MTPNVGNYVAVDSYVAQFEAMLCMQEHHQIWLLHLCAVYLNNDMLGQRGHCYTPSGILSPRCPRCTFKM